MSTEHKPLSAAEIEAIGALLEEMRRNRSECGGMHSAFYEQSAESVFRALPRLLAMLTPPADAAVREAVGYVAEFLACEDDPTGGYKEDIRTLLSYVRAAQAPRLTGERLAVLKSAHLTLLDHHGLESEAAWLEAAFPELGEG